MKIIDRDGRLVGKISIVDVIVLLVVAAMVRRERHRKVREREREVRRE